jgi:hypothetical protein
MKGYVKVPKRFMKNLEKEFKGKTYDDKNLLAINKNFRVIHSSHWNGSHKPFYKRLYADLSFPGKEKDQYF